MYKLSPSDFAYLYQDCKFCYVQKVKIGKNLKNLSSSLPDGEVIAQEKFVESIIIPGTSVYLKGKYDLLVKNYDGTHTIVDLKISQPGEDKIDKFKTQLGAYKFALENPKFEEPIKLTKLALLIFYPDQVSFENEAANLDFPHTWLEVPIDDVNFLNFIKEVNSVLSGPEPTVSEKCKWCIYRKYFEPKSKVVDDIPF